MTPLDAAPQGSTTGPRLLVVTVVHRPDDARILHRQIALLRAEGYAVTYAAPWRATGVVPPEGLDVRDLPRSTGRERLAALLAARDLLRAEAAAHDLVLLHDPELLVALRLAGVSRVPPVVWDVHEDTAVALGDREWVPTLLRRILAWAVRRLERWAERNVHLILAEDGYRDRFRRTHPVVRNHPWASQRPDPTVSVAPDVPPRVVYVGRISRGRGIGTVLALARALEGTATVELAGPVDAGLEGEVEAAASEGLIVWHGFVPNDRIGPLLAGASVGLSLLSDDPNYRVSMPSKVIEYLAHGVPVVATPLPAVTALLDEEGGGLLVPFDDVEATVAAVRRILDEPGLRTRLSDEGKAAAARCSWEVEGARLASTLRTWAS
jgi:glycosyltransferase involved in cell wall biosynthesis